MTVCFSSEYYEKCALVPALTCNKMIFKEIASRDIGSKGNDAGGKKTSGDCHVLNIMFVRDAIQDNASIVKCWFCFWARMV